MYHTFGAIGYRYKMSNMIYIYFLIILMLAIVPTQQQNADANVQCKML